MKISTEQINVRMKNLQPVYLLSGDECLLIEEAAETIRNVARDNGFVERKVFHVDAKFNWQILLDEANALSLFADKSVLELRIPSGKINDSGKKTLEKYLENIPPEKLLIIITSKLPGTTLNTKWAKAIDKNGAIIQAWPIALNQFPQWIQKRLQNKGLNASAEIAKLIADQTEGNLLAANQEIEKLFLLFGNATLTLNDVVNAISDSAKFDVFKLADYFLLNDKNHYLRILKSLQNEGAEPTIILWALTKDFRSLFSMAHDLKKGQNIESVLSKHFVWEKRKPIIKTALKNLSLKKLETLLKKAAKIDKIIKGIEKGNVWNELDNFIVFVRDCTKVNAS